MKESMSTSTATESMEMPPREGIKDTLESIVVALILAFVFRAFVVEAFVIPTGSMAPTLYGAHATIVCEDCGTEFAYGLRDLDDQRRVQQVLARDRAVCPNCNHPNTNLKINDHNRKTEKGDRILVLKWPFDIGGPGLDPLRWDVIVFKDPADGVTNFIKRLAGLPNEVLMIVDGDVHTVATDRLSPETLEELERYRHEKYERRVGLKRGPLKMLPPRVFQELEQKLTIAHKSAEAQEALWTVVYDHDYSPRTLEKQQPRWVAGLGEQSGWDPRTRRVRFKNRGEQADFIELIGKRISAGNAYNVHGRVAPPVSDHRVRFVITPSDQKATVRVRLVKLGRTFWASIRMDGLVALTESANVPSWSTPAMVSKHLPPFAPGKPVQISFANVDYRLAVRVRGEEVLATSSDRDSEVYYGPNVKALRARMLSELRSRTRKKTPPAYPPRIYGEGGDVEITHLVVERDIYYYNDSDRKGLGHAAWAPRLGWGSVFSPILLREDEHFMLGDNTSASKDSRLWDVVGEHLAARGEEFQLGTVPRDQLIGKAFFVYWPSGYRLDWLPVPLLNRWGVIPDVGRMRWIR